MKLPQLLAYFSIILPGCAVVSPEEEFGFIYSYSFNRTYNSFTQTFTQEMCRTKNSLNFKVSLTKDEDNLVKEAIVRNQMLLMPQEISNVAEDATEIMVTSPCSSDEILIQKGTELNRIKWGCNLNPDNSSRYLSQVEEVGDLIRSILNPKINALNPPDTECIYY